MSRIFLDTMSSFPTPRAKTHFPLAARGDFGDRARMTWWRDIAQYGLPQRAKLALVVASIAIAAMAMRAESERPMDGVVMDFEDDAQLERLVWQCPIAMETTAPISGRGRRALLVHLKPGLYPGVEIHDPPGDWRDGDALEFTVAAPAAEGDTLHLRIDDADSREDYDRRYEGRIRLAGGPQLVRIPLSEIAAAPAKDPLDLSRITKIVIYLYRSDRDVDMTIDDIRLVRLFPD